MMPIHGVLLHLYNTVPLLPRPLAFQPAGATPRHSTHHRPWKHPGALLSSNAVCFD